MKLFIWEYIKTALILAGIEILLFVVMIFFLMTDETVGVIGKTLGVLVKYIIGFPLVLINSDFPFFLDSKNPPNYMIALIVLNILIQAGIIIFIKRILKAH